VKMSSVPKKQRERFDEKARKEEQRGVGARKGAG